jgi:serine/threonine protein kinase
VESTPALPGFDNLELISRGVFGTVYKAVHAATGNDVAVKVSNTSVSDDEGRRRFLREIEAVGRMNTHPHVVGLRGSGSTGNGRVYYVMELCRSSYADLLRAGPVHPAVVIDVGEKIADALAGAHRKGILHLDVKPSNILLTMDNRPVLADFGTAAIAGAHDGRTVLTPAYAPKEMLQGGAPTAAADVYSLCATLYALASGRPPRWDRDQTLQVDEGLALLDTPIAPLPGSLGWLWDIISGGLSNTPTDRPTASALRRELRGDRHAADLSGDHIAALLLWGLREARSARMLDASDVDEITGEIKPRHVGG